MDGIGQERRKQEAGDETELLKKLETWLVSYDRVFLVPGENGTAGDFASAILHAAAGKTGERRILVLSAVPVTVGAGFTYRQIRAEEQEQLIQLYYMYEFADNFSVIAKTNAYGGLSHLVDTGKLSMGEAAEALFMY